MAKTLYFCKGKDSTYFSSHNTRYDKMNDEINLSWKSHLQPEFEKEYFKSLISFIKEEYSNGLCYPPKEEIFNAFNHVLDEE